MHVFPNNHNGSVIHYAFLKLPPSLTLNNLRICVNYLLMSFFKHLTLMNRNEQQIGLI